MGMERKSIIVWINKYGKGELLARTKVETTKIGGDLERSY